MKKIALLTILISTFFIQSVKGQTTAIYDVTFSSIWNAGDHTSIPPNAHWSKLVGATHKTANEFFQVGGIATTGVKNIAETGNNTVFNAEVTTQITNTEADQYIDGPSLATATGDMMISNLSVSEDFPILTLMSMIAPSPDWMIGVNGFSFLDGTSSWKTTETIDIFALDAGTDDGADYTSVDALSNPFQAIAVKNGAPFQGVKIGTLTITLKDVLAVDDNYTLQNASIYPNPVANGKLNISNLGDVVLDEIHIYNLSGKRIKSFNENMYDSHFSLDIKEVPAGIYLLKLVSDQGKSMVRKLIVE